MKKFFISAAAGALLAGCATAESGRVQNAPDGTRVYGLNDQPQATITGEGTLMPGAYQTRQMPLGQFTGQERTHDVIGQRPTPPRETDAREFARNGAPVVGGGAGTLGQSGMTPGINTVTSSNLVSMSPDLTRVSGEPAPIANPPTLATAPTLAQPLTNPPSNRNSTPGTLPEGAVGAAPGPQFGGANSLSNNSHLNRQVAIPRADEALRATPPSIDSTAPNSAGDELAARIRDSLVSGRPDSITRLTPAEVKRFEIEAVNGNVTLRGDVRSETEKLTIGNKVAQMEGVRSVNNQLRVTGPGQAADKIMTTAPEAPTRTE